MESSIIYTRPAPREPIGKGPRGKCAGTHGPMGRCGTPARHASRALIPGWRPSLEAGRLQRVDRPLIPPDAMREILVNALIHRDYTIAGGAVSRAINAWRVSCRRGRR